MSSKSWLLAKFFRKFLTFLGEEFEVDEKIELYEYIQSCD